MCLTACQDFETPECGMAKCGFVISPLITLMKDQVVSFTTSGVTEHYDHVKFIINWIPLGHKYLFRVTRSSLFVTCFCPAS